MLSQERTYQTHTTQHWWPHKAAHHEQTNRQCPQPSCLRPLRDPLTLTPCAQPAQSQNGQLCVPYASPGRSWQPGPRIGAACQELGTHNPPPREVLTQSCACFAPVALAQESCGKHHFPFQAMVPGTPTLHLLSTDTLDAGPHWRFLQSTWLLSGKQRVTEAAPGG